MRRITGPLLWLWRNRASPALWQYVAPTTTALYVNWRYLRDPPASPELPDKPWARLQAHELLGRSEERLRGIEAKGPGLATVTAIVGAAVLVAIPEGWHRSDDLGRTLLVVAATFSAFSLITPICLVGPLRRAQLWTGDLEEAAKKHVPEKWLADRAVEAAMENTSRVNRLANLQAAARNDLAWALVALLLWALLVPATRALVRHPCSHPPGKSGLRQRTCD